MGLDMYLFTGKTEVAYWRKANQIHGWFDRTLAPVTGIEDCKYYKVSRTQLKQLIQDCETVLASLKNGTKQTKEVVKEYHINNGEVKANKHTITVYEETQEVKQLLPPTEGFFFGSIDVTESYLIDLSDTISMLKDVLKNPLYKGKQFKYYAWW